VLAALCGSLLAVACAPGTVLDPSAVTELTRPGNEWLIVVYMSADNELESRALEDINEMEAGFYRAGDRLSQTVSVVVLLDRSAAHSAELGDWSDTRLFEIVADERGDAARIVSPRLSSVELGIASDDTEELNTGAPGTLSRLLAFAAAAYPAERTALVVWGLGGGYRAVSVDDGNGSDLLLTAELGEALDGHDVQTVAMDLPLGAQLEIACELNGYAGELLASQDAVDTDGWEYDAFLVALARQPSGEDAFARAAIEAFRAERHGTPGSCISAVDLTEVPTVAAALDELSVRLHDIADTEADRQAVREMLFNEVEDFYRTPGELSLDLKDLAAVSARSYPSVEPAARALSAAVEQAVRESWCAAGANPDAHGLSLHFVPLDAEGYAFPPHAPAYFRGRVVSHPLRFVASSRWVPDDERGAGLLYRLWYESL
jgi:hypothetical protein